MLLPLMTVAEQYDVPVGVVKESRPTHLCG